MDIASSIFWIVLGLLYILYQAFKEYPAQTLTCIVAIAITLVVGFVFMSILNAADDSPFWSVAIVLPAFIIAVYFKEKDGEKTRQALNDHQALYNEALDMAYERARNGELTEQELRDWEKTAWAKYQPAYNDYAAEKVRYRQTKDPTEFVDLIVDDYIRHRLVFKIMAELRKNMEEK